MHLTYPDRSDRFNLDELRCLASALGFELPSKPWSYIMIHKDVFTRHIHVANKSRFYVETKVLLNLIDRKVFNHDLHETHNLHDGVYNVKVLEKSLNVLSKRIITFSELKSIRIAFDVYECPDLSGMEINPHIILRALKMFGRIASPRRLMDYIKHMPRDFPDRLTLYELLDLVPLCERISDVKIQLQRQADHKRRARSDASELVDFQEILLQEDKKQINFLDEDYEQSFFRPSFEDKPTWRVPPEDAINNEEWKKHVLAYRQVAHGLDEGVEYTNRQVVRARTGTPGHHTTFRDINVSPGNDQSRKTKKVSKPETTRCCSYSAEDHTLLEGTTGNHQNKSRSSSTPDCAWPLVNKPRQYCWSVKAKDCQFKMRMDNVLVTKEELQDTNTKIVNLLWDLEMKDTLQNIRLKGKEPKAKQKMGTPTRKQIASEETYTLQKSDDNIKQEHIEKMPTILSRSPTSATDLYKLMSARSKKRDHLLSRTKETSDSSGTESARPCIKAKRNSIT